MLGYLGPEGTFTHQALLQLVSGDDMRPYASVGLALEAVRDGSVEAALVPIENSVEGGVTATLDDIGDPANPLQIVRETVLNIRFNLCTRPGVQLSEIKTIASHPHALAQVRNWLDENFPEAEIMRVGSTAQGANFVAEGKADATVCSAIAGDLHGLEAQVSDVADNPSATTRFVLVTKRQKSPARTGHDKTTLVAYMHRDEPGALLNILQQFAVRGVNMCRIESRPTKTSLGNYCFSIDAEGHIEDLRLADTLIGLKRICQDVIFLGSYERANGVEPMNQRGGTDPEYTDAMNWVRSIGGRI